MKRNYMISKDHIKKIFDFVGSDFFDELEEHSVHTVIQSRQEILKEGEKIHYIPILLHGSIKVYSLNDGKEFLYYYIKPDESCIMTFSSVFTDNKSLIYSCTEESSEILLLPVAKVLKWIKDYPLLNHFFFKEYHKRYTDMMSMTSQAVFHKLDKRIYDLISRKIDENNGDPIKISHKEIANILGTAREVVSRILKKFENEGIISRPHKKIDIINQIRTANKL